MAYVFLSHSHQDKTFARKLAADLRRNGHNVWIDEAEINIGDSLIEKIRSGLDQVDYVVALLSNASIKSAWVNKELEIASNREIDEKRVVVMPLLLDNVDLPGFLKGKFHGDFKSTDKYQESLALLLRSLDGTTLPKASTFEEIELLKIELEAVRQIATREKKSAQRASEAAFQGKSEKLKKAINTANKKFPHHAPINRTYAFEMNGTIVTLDYALWAISKAMREGTHILEALLTLHNRWHDIENMLEAYQDMIDRA